MIALTSIRQFETGVSDVLDAIDTAIEVQALAEDLPIVGHALSSNATDATNALEGMRAALLAGLATLQDVAGHSIQNIEDAMNDALDAAGLGRVLSVIANGSGFDVAFNLSQAGTSSVAIESDLGMAGLGLAVSGSADLSATAGSISRLAWTRRASISIRHPTRSIFLLASKMSSLGPPRRLVRSTLLRRILAHRSRVPLALISVTMTGFCASAKLCRCPQTSLLKPISRSRLTPTLAMPRCRRSQPNWWWSGISSTRPSRRMTRT